MPASTPLIDFQWQLSRQGYTVLDQQQSRFLTDGLPRNAWVEDKLYKEIRPLDENESLFSKFAHIKPSEDNIISFANKYGLLGGEITQRIELTPIDGRAVYCEPISEWFEAIEELRTCVSLWESIVSAKLYEVEEKAAQLRPIVQAEEETCHQFAAPIDEYAYSVNAEGGKVFELSDISRSQEVLPDVQEAKLLLQKYVNFRLYDQQNVVVKLLWKRDLTNFDINIVPNSLIDAMWLQFAVAVSNVKRFGQCAQCGSLINIASSGRATRMYCGDPCKRKMSSTLKQPRFLISEQF